MTSLNIAKDFLFPFNKDRGMEFISEIWGRSPLFICVIATTETAKIPGISAAGKNPELTDYTPAADVELLIYKECKCIKGLPVTPEGIPTPAIITMSALELADIPFIVVDAGTKIKPNTPYVTVGGEPGENIRLGRAVKNPEEIFRRSCILGSNLAKLVDYIVIGESIPGGTTTALGLLIAMGIDAEGKVSSSMPNNPHSLKERVVMEGLTAAGYRKGDLKQDPLTAVSVVGDPMMIAFAGLVAGAGKNIPVIMAGGTQMAAVLAILKFMKPDILDNVIIGTTRWIIEDESSDLVGLVSQIEKIPIIAANLNFSSSRYSGLKAYERGVVKEGVGAGGITISAISKLKGKINCKNIVSKIEENYKNLLAKIPIS